MTTPLPAAGLAALFLLAPAAAWSQDADPPADPAAVTRRAIVELDAKLAAPYPLPIEIEGGQPLSEVLATVCETAGVDCVVEREILALDGLSTPELEVAPLSITRTPVSLRTLLEQLLQPAELTAVNHDGLLVVTTVSKAEDWLFLRVYNVRDLVPVVEASTRRMINQGGGNFGGGGGAFSVSPQFGRVRPARDAVDVGVTKARADPAAVYEYDPAGLIEIVLNETGGSDNGGPWVETEGIGGDLVDFDGLLVVRQTDAVHHQIATLLARLRAEDRDGERLRRTAGDLPAGDDPETGGTE